jgi:hypothetical protein
LRLRGIFENDPLDAFLVQLLQVHEGTVLCVLGIERVRFEPSVGGIVVEVVAGLDLVSRFFRSMPDNRLVCAKAPKAQNANPKKNILFIMNELKKIFLTKV